MKFLFILFLGLSVSLCLYSQESSLFSSETEPNMFTYKRLHDSPHSFLKGSSSSLNAFSPAWERRTSMDLTSCMAYRMPMGDTSYNSAYPMKKRFWRASAYWFLSQLAPWSWNYFVRDAEFAHISWESIKNNLPLSAWTWDDNNFTTNQFAHPYHGNLYFNAFRVNGYNYWGSAAATLAGSFAWEVAGETHPPAPNDLINTTLGGIALGEMIFRVSNRIINKKERGFKRQMTEVFALLLNPANGVNRIIDGKWGRVSSDPVTEYDTTSLRGELDLGARQISSYNGELFTKGRTGWYANVRLLYGNEYKVAKKPFSNFDLRVELGDDDSAKLNVVYVNGLLHSWGWRENERVTHLFSLTANYNFYHNSQFEYGAQNFNFNLYSQFNKQGRVKYDTRFGGGAIALAAIPNTYMYYGEGRDYDYGPGVSMVGRARMHVSRLTLMAEYIGGWFSTINGDNSSYFLHAFSGEARYHVFKNVSVGFSGGYFGLRGYYVDYPDVQLKYPMMRLFIGLRI